MRHNFSANRLRHYVQFFAKSDTPNSSGVLDTYVEVFDCRADVDVKSGAQLEKFGAIVTSSVVTILTWYNPNINSKQLALWEGDYYEVHHFQPSDDRKSMLVTCERIGDQSVKVV